MDTTDEQSLECRLPVENMLGLHARAAARIAETVGCFDCKVTLSKSGTEAEADSILSVLTLDAPMGSTLTARAQGPQAAEAIDALQKLFADRFGEGK